MSTVFELSIPDENETKISFKVGTNDPIEFDIFDYFEWLESVQKQLKFLGTSDTSVFYELMSKVFEEKTGKVLNKPRMAYIITQLDKFEDELKKKYPSLFGLFDSTDSTLNQKPNET